MSPEVRAIPPRAGITSLISGNWKMNGNHFEAISLVQELSAAIRSAGVPKRAMSLHPPFTSIRTVQTALESDHVPIALGAQNCHDQPKGAYTGEVSADMLAKLNVSYVIVGHSERRRYFFESDEFVRAKFDAVLRAQMTPILCVGETKQERDEGLADARVIEQVRAVMAGRDAAAVLSCVIAYEPLWAIGTGENASPSDAQAMCGLIKDELGELCGAERADALVQYGGSVSVDNAAGFLHEADVDGLLVGGGSLDAGSFMAIARAGEARRAN